MMKKISVLVLAVLMFHLFIFYVPVHAEDPTPTPSSASSEKEIRDTITELEKTISLLKGKGQTLSSDIKKMDTQISLTEWKIKQTKQDIITTEENIQTITKKIATLETSLDQSISLFLHRIVSTYKNGSVGSLQLILSSESMPDLLAKSSYLKVVQTHDRSLLYQMQHSKMNFSDQKTLLEHKQEELQTLKKELESRTKELAVQKVNKQRLLRETQGSEANYQKLLAQAKEQLAGFSRFVENQGGASLLPNQTMCDDWGCYYSQRDTQWGGLSLNGTQYTLASDGCLVTSMAMVLTHYKHKTIPIDINANPSNFASYYPAYLLFTISVNGITADRIGSQIDSALSSGDPVVVGLYAYGGTHFVVLKSGSKGDYVMHDPYIKDGHNLKFSDHYSVNKIFEIHKVVIR